MAKQDREYWAKLRRQFMGEYYDTKGAYSEMRTPKRRKVLVDGSQERIRLNEKGPL